LMNPLSSSEDYYTLVKAIEKCAAKLFNT